MTLILGGLALFVGGLVAASVMKAVPFPPELLAVIGVGFAVLILTSLYAQFFGFRCPWCRGNLAPLAFNRPGFSFNPKIRFCPYCGRELDDELPAAGATEGDEPGKEW